jgi:type I restriction enzyme R subunit
VVRPHRQLVHRYLDRSQWDGLDPQRIAEIGTALAGLPSAERDDDEEAKRFDLLILRAQLCVLDHQQGFAGIAEQVREIAGALLEQTSIPAIREQQVFLDALTDPQWWIDVTVPMLEEARRRLRSLVRLIERAKRKIVYTDFTDEMGELTELSALPGSGPVNGGRFLAKVRDFLRQHEDHLAIHKLRRNVALTAADLDELDRMLVEAGQFDREQLDRAVAEVGGNLGLFVRSLVGLNRAAVQEALSAFLQDATLTANQIEFLNMVVEHLTRHGTLSPAKLFEAPFNEVAPRGPDVIFPQQFADIVVALDEFRHRASGS